MEGVRSYKKASDKQREALSDLLNCKQSTAVKQYKPSSIGGIAPTHHQHSFKVSEQAVVLAINISEPHSLSSPTSTFKNCEINFFVGFSGAATILLVEPREEER